jgi:hypothetical protein
LFGIRNKAQVPLDSRRFASIFPAFVCYASNSPLITNKSASGVKYYASYLDPVAHGRSAEQRSFSSNLVTGCPKSKNLATSQPAEIEPSGMGAVCGLLDSGAGLENRNTSSQ